MLVIRKNAQKSFSCRLRATSWEGPGPWCFLRGSRLVVRGYRAILFVPCGSRDSPEALDRSLGQSGSSLHGFGVFVEVRSSLIVGLE